VPGADHDRQRGVIAVAGADRDFEDVFRRRVAEADLARLLHRAAGQRCGLDCTCRDECQDGGKENGAHFRVVFPDAHPMRWREFWLEPGCRNPPSTDAFLTPGTNSEHHSLSPWQATPPKWLMPRLSAKRKGL